MQIYFIVWLFLCAAAMFDFSAIPQKQKNYIAVVSAVIACLFCGLRGDVDKDYANYVGYWNNAPSLLNCTIGSFIVQIIRHRVEPGYIFTCAVLKTLGLNAQAIFLFCSILTFAIFYKIAKKISPMPNLSLLLFFSLFIMLPFMQIRFGVAIVCIFYGILCWREGMKKKSVTLFIVAALFHNLTWGCLLALPLLRLETRYLIWLTALSILIPSFLIRTIAAAVFNTLGAYSGYLVGEDSLSMLSIFFNIVIILPVLYLYKLNKLSITTILLIKAYLIYIIISLTVRDIAILARIGIVFSLSSCFIIPYYLRIMKQNNFHYLVFALLIFTYCFLKYLPCLKFFEPYKINFIL